MCSLAAFDASTLVSYKYLYEDRGGCDVAAGVLVHDFDVPYDNTPGCAKLVERVKKTLDRAGLEVKLMRTNSNVPNAAAQPNARRAAAET